MKFGWHIPMDELIDSLYGLSFDSLSYDNQAEVLNFIKARVDKMMGRTSKDIKEGIDDWAKSEELCQFVTC